MTDQIPQEKILVNGKPENILTKCHYPECTARATSRVLVNLNNSPDNSVELPFCKYHSLIVMGGFFKVKQIDDTFTLMDHNGTFHIIELIEQVIGARESMKVKAVLNIMQPKSVDSEEFRKKDD